MSNKTKDKIFITFFLVAIVWLVILLFVAIVSLFADYSPVLNEREQINKYYAEQTIQNEMSSLATWDYVENMSEQEYYDTFFKNDCAEYEYVMKKEKEEVKKCQKN